MPFSIPNSLSATYPFQAEPDSVDFTIMAAGAGQTGFVSGCSVVASGPPAMNVVVAAGTLLFNGQSVTVSGATVTIAAADGTNPRFDLIVSSSAGALSAVTGSPTSHPSFPSIPASSIVLAAVYIPAAASSVANTQIVDKRVGLVPLLTINVKAYGAKGDGSTDDTTAIAAAIAALPTNGGEVYFPPGVYISGQQTINSGQWLRGAGYQATILQLKNSTNADLLISTNFATLVGGNTTGGVYNCGIRDMTLDGNKANNTAGRGMSIYGYGYRLDNLRIRNFASHGIYTEWSTSSASPGNDSMEAHITNFKIHDCAGHGIFFNGPHDSIIHAGQIYSCGTTNANYGVYAASSSATGLEIMGVHCWGGAVGYQYYLNTTVKMTGCLGEGATIAQCLIRAGFCQIEDCWFFGAGVASSGIVLGLASDGTTSCRIRARCDGFSGHAVDYTNAGDNNYVEIHNYRSVSPTGIGGTPSGFNTLMFFEHADAGPTANSRYQFCGQANIVPPADEVVLTLRGYFSGQTNNLIEAHDNGDNQAFIVDAWGRLRHQEVANVTAAMQTAAGTSPPAAVVTGTDVRGFITFGTGTGPTTGNLIKVSFGHAFTAAPKVVISPSTALTTGLGLYLNPSNTTTTDFTVSCQTAPAASQGNTVYGFTYIVID